MKNILLVAALLCSSITRVIVGTEEIYRAYAEPHRYALLKDVQEACSNDEACVGDDAAFSCETLKYSEYLIDRLAQIEHWLRGCDNPLRAFLLRMERRDLIKELMSRVMLLRIPHGGAPFVGSICCVPNEESLDNLQVTGIALVNNLLVNTLSIAGDLSVGGNVAVGGNISFGGTLCAPNGSAVAPSYAFCNDPGSGFFLQSANEIGLVNGDGNPSVVFSPGAVVTIAPSATNFSQLVVNGGTLNPAVVVNAAVGRNGIAVTDGTVAVPAYGFNNDATAGMLRPAANSLALAAGSNYKLYADTDGARLQNHSLVSAFRGGPAQFLYGPGPNTLICDSIAIGSGYNTSTGEWTVPVAGRYFFTFGLTLDIEVNTGPFPVDFRTFIDIHVNGSPLGHYRTWYSDVYSAALTIGQYRPIAISGLLDLQQGDVVSFVLTPTGLNTFFPVSELVVLPNSMYFTAHYASFN